MTELRAPSDRRRTTAGVLLSLGAAAMFGVLTPAAKGALAHVGPLRAAGLAYLAAGVVALTTLLLRRSAGMTALGRPLTRGDHSRLLGLIIFGGVLGPALFFAGVSRVAGHTAAVVQHLEFAFTVAAAMFVLGERPGRRAIAGLFFVGAGVVLLSWPGVGLGDAGAASGTGVALIVAACVAWAADNTLARGASDLDPLLVVSIKGVGAGVVLILASAGSAWPRDARGWGLLFLAGGVGVGASLVMELLALRRIGAALNAGLFATGPAFGFAWSLLFLGEQGSSGSWAALVACAIGAVMLAADRHAHAHAHRSIRHAHRHDHLDGHHDHPHETACEPSAGHAHEHEHASVLHAHPHVHDEHHRHRHQR